jgi:hypothetical protein
VYAAEENSPGPARSDNLPIARKRDKELLLKDSYNPPMVFLLLLHLII